MATISYVASGGLVGGQAAINVGPPAGIQNGDLLLLLCESANQTIVVNTAGWTQVGNQANQGVGTAAGLTATRIAIFYKFTTGTEANVSIADSGDHTVGQIFAFRNVDRLNPFNATASGASGTANGTALTLPSVTTTIPNAMVLLCTSTSFDGNGVATFNVLPTNANLTSITERGDLTANNGNGGGIAIWTSFKTTVGSTGTTSATSAQSAVYGYLTIALRPKRRIITAI